MALFLVPDPRVRDAGTQLDELSMYDGLIGPQRSRGQVAAMHCQRQGDYSYLNRQHRQSAIYGGMIRMDLWYWLISHGVSRNQTGKSTTFLFNFISRKILKQMEEDYTGS